LAFLRNNLVLLVLLVQGPESGEESPVHVHRTKLKLIEELGAAERR
jgi:hypothetical protein